MLVDELREELPAGALFGQIVTNELVSATFQVGDRLAAARSTRLEVDLDLLRHFFLTHQASAFAATAGFGGGAVA